MSGMFISTFEKTIDKQGRVCVPVDFRNVLLRHRADNASVGFIAFRSYSNQTIDCYSFERMEKLSNQMDTLDPFSPDQDDFGASVFADSHMITFDMDEGRIKIPQILLDHAKIEKTACFVGKGATFQIWEPNAFSEYQEKARKTLQKKWEESRKNH